MSVRASRHPLAQRAFTTSVITVAAAACLIATSAPASAYDADFPADLACIGFGVGLDFGQTNRTSRTFEDKDGNTVVLTTGRAESVVVTNVKTGESVTAPARGVRTRATTDDNGTVDFPADDITTFEFTGNLLLVLFSTDIGGAGLPPSSTTLIAGRTVFTVDAEGIYIVQSVSGKTTDICEVLAS